MLRITLALTIVTLTTACDSVEETSQRDFAILPTPSTCLRLEEVFTNPIGSDANRQWVNIRNRCGSEVDLAQAAIRWTGGGGSWELGASGIGLGLSGADVVEPWGCITIAGPMTSVSSDADIVAAFVPAMQSNDSISPAAAVGLFTRTGTLPFDAVVYGGPNINDIPVAGGTVPATSHIGWPAVGHSMRFWFGSWIDEPAPQPQHCGLN